jgi:hypothetical protein
LILPLAAAANGLIQRRGWINFGYSGCGDFTQECLGRTSRWLRDLAALDDCLPALRLALTGDDGGPPLGRCAALGIARTAQVENIDAWIELARTTTAREFREALREARRRNGHRVRRDEPSKNIELRTTFETSDDIQASIDPGHEAPGTELDPDADDFAESIRWGIWLPRAARAAFQEAHRFHSVLAGKETGLAAFIEALVAESTGRLDTPEPEAITETQTEHPGCGRPSCEDAHKLQVSSEVPSLVGALAPSHIGTSAPSYVGTSVPSYVGTSAPSHVGASRVSNPDVFPIGSPPTRTRFESTRKPSMPRPASSSSFPFDEMEELLEQIEAAGTEGPKESLASLVQRLRALIQLEDTVERSLGRIMAYLEDVGAWHALGFESFATYAEDRLGWSRSTAAERTWMARSLVHLPRLREAYNSGDLSFSTAVLARRAIGRSRDPGVESAWVNFARHAYVKRLRDELRIIEWHHIEEPGRISMPSSDAEWHASLHRAPGTTRDRVARFVARALEDGGLGSPEASSDVADAKPRTLRNPDVFLAFDLPEDMAIRWRASIGAACESIFQRTGSPVPLWAGMLELVWHFVTTWDDPQGCPKRAWDAIYARDDWRCMAPGCTARVRLQDHHVVYRSHQGSDDPWNQITQCMFHHQQGEHGTLARVRGRAPLELTWRLGEPELATWARNERRIGAQ